MVYWKFWCTASETRHASSLGRDWQRVPEPSSRLEIASPKRDISLSAGITTSQLHVANIGLHMVVLSASKAC